LSLYWTFTALGRNTDIYDSMAEGVQGAACVVCFMSQAYQVRFSCCVSQAAVQILRRFMMRYIRIPSHVGYLDAPFTH
jgi:hypothetical protein